MIQRSVREIKLPRFDDMVMLCVSPENLDRFWPHVKDLIGRALLTGIGDLSLTDVHGRLVEKRSQLWVVVREKSELRTEIIAAATTEIHLLPRHKILVITSCAGKDIRKWERFISELETFAAREGCDKIRVYGRKGWLKILSGWEQPWIALERVLKPEKTYER